MEEIILKPDKKLLSENEYYLFYEMMMHSLKTDNVKEGLNKSLELLQIYLRANKVSLYKKNDSGIYVYKRSSNDERDTIQPMSCILNKTKNLFEDDKHILDLDLDLSDRFRNVMILHMPLKETDVVLTINNYDKEIVNNSNNIFWESLRETMLIILKRAASYERNISAMSMDLLTKCDNRNSYEERIKSIDDMNEPMVIGVFDLFRLKYINDNYGHKVGDNYIKYVSTILRRYWPKYIETLDENGMEEKKETGHCVYRIGGDEFVLMTKKESINLVKLKTQLVEDEVSRIKLVPDQNIIVGINSGIAALDQELPYKTVFEMADEEMQAKKKEMYKTYGIERRR